MWSLLSIFVAAGCIVQGAHWSSQRLFWEALGAFFAAACILRVELLPVVMEVHQTMRRDARNENERSQGIVADGEDLTARFILENDSQGTLIIDQESDWEAERLIEGTCVSREEIEDYARAVTEVLNRHEILIHSCGLD